MFMWTIGWAVAFVVLVVIELATVGLTTIWFAAGSIVSLVLSLFKVPEWVQIVVFFAVSILLLVFTRPLLKNLLKKKPQPMNTDRVLNRKCIVTEKIDGLSGNGCVKIDGILWSAKAEKEDDEIEVGTKVIVKGVDGVKVIVAIAEDK